MKKDLFRSINNSRASSKDFFFENIDKTLWPVAIGSPIILYGISKYKNDEYLKNASIILASSELATLIEFTILKHFIKRQRPFRNLQNVNTLDTIGIDEFSFPSGHASTAFSIATTISLLYPDKKIIIPILIWATTVSYGRIYLGVHYPSDVISGAIIGGATSYFCFKFQNEILNFTENKKGESLTLLPIQNGFYLNYQTTF